MALLNKKFGSKLGQFKPGRFTPGRITMEEPPADDAFVIKLSRVMSSQKIKFSTKIRRVL